MIRRMVLILIAASQIAALPVTIAPETIELGKPLTVSINLPAPSTELVGFPDLGTFALLLPPERIGNTCRLHLLPLRPGIQLLPSIPFRTDQRFSESTPLTLSVAAPSVRESPHPLRPFPELPREAQSRPTSLLIVIAASFTLLGLIGAVYFRRRSPAVIQSKTDLDEQFSLLAAMVRETPDQGGEEWTEFRHHLERVRFGPLSRNEEQLQRLTADFIRLRGESS